MNSIATQPITSSDAGSPRQPTCPSPWSAGWLAHRLLRPYNRLRHAFTRQNARRTCFPELAAVRERATSLTDIDEHLELMFIEGLLCRPRLIVELGVRSGASTFVFERVAQSCNSVLISCDLNDCSSVSSYTRWYFVKDDDIRFANSFPGFCRTRAIVPTIDLLFVDTSHYYEHTVQEIASWFPFLSSNAKVMFHDTNLRLIGPRNDGCAALGWDNQRGVIRAIEEVLGTHIDETQRYITRVPEWLVRHWPNCNGFTILDRRATPSSLQLSECA